MRIPVGASSSGQVSVQGSNEIDQPNEFAKPELSLKAYGCSNALGRAAISFLKENNA
jgi:hypothetical protein